ncbi:MAG: PilC/PilY family type IV pilus protein [Saccharospirillum sp.]
MVSSTPAYVADTSIAWPDYIENNFFGGDGLGESHSYFRDTVVRDRTPMIYVGVNDGMLHGFDATNGTGGGVERFAYIPSVMFSSEVGKGLHYLTDPDYTHRFYVDAEPAYTDVYVDRDGVEEWRTLLSGGFRTGAKGFYALDITDPAEFTAGNVSDRVMFEYSDPTDTHLGYMFERPSIGMLNNGEWALIYGNGYNSESEQGAIYVVFVERVLARGFVLGDTFYKFPTGRGGAINGITTIDTDTDKVIDAVYASDAGGYIWKLDLSDLDETEWDYAYDGPEPFFEARSSTGAVQPIITRPRVIRHTSISDSNNAPNRMVIFGTGSMVENADLDNTDVQSFYTVWDDGSQSAALTRDNLLESTVTTETNADGFPVRTIGNSGDPWKQKGFFFDMPGTGERILDYVDIRASRDTGEDYALFSSIIPDSDVCNYGGASWVMAADLASGKSPTYAVFDANQDGVIDDADAGIGGVFSSDYLVDFVAVGATGYGNTSMGDIVTINIEEGLQTFSGRLGWQELIAR